MKVRTKQETFCLLSPNKQSAYGTALPDTAFTLLHDHQETRVKESYKKAPNTDMVGKKGDNTTRIVPISTSAALPLSFDLSTAIAAWVTSLNCGKITASQPDPTGSPDVWVLEIENANLKDPLVGKQLPVTSILQVMGENDQQKKYRDMLIQDFSISGNKEEQMKIECNALGSGYWEAPDPLVTIPDPVQTDFLLTGQVNFSVGGQDVSALLDTFKFAQKNEVSEKEGYYPGSPYLSFIKGEVTSNYQTRGRCLTSKRSQELEFSMLQNTDTIDAKEIMLHNEINGLTIAAEGNPIDETYNHKLEIIIPELFFLEVEEGESDGFDTYEVKTDLSWDSTNNRAFLIKITTNMTGFLTNPT